MAEGGNESETTPVKRSSTDDDDVDVFFNPNMQRPSNPIPIPDSPTFHVEYVDSLNVTVAGRGSTSSTRDTYPDSAYSSPPSPDITWPPKPWLCLIPFDTCDLGDPIRLGRERQLEELRKTLTEQRTAVVCGGIGMGKSAFVAYYATQEQKNGKYKNGVLWINVSKNEIETKIQFAGLASHLKINVAKDNIDDAEKTVLEWLQHHEDWLLVIDGSHKNTTRRLAVLGPRDRYQGHILYTAQTQPEMMKKEQIVPITLEKLTPNEMKMFFTERVRQAKGDFEESELSELVQCIDGIPLVLEQIASYLLENGLTFAEYMNMYRTNRKLPLVHTSSNDHERYLRDNYKETFKEVKSPVARAILKLGSFCHCRNIPFNLFLHGSEQLRDFCKESNELSLTCCHELKALMEVQLELRNRPDAQEQLKVNELHILYRYNLICYPPVSSPGMTRFDISETLQTFVRELLFETETEMNSYLLCLASMLVGTFQSYEMNAALRRALVPHARSCADHLYRPPLTNEGDSVEPPFLMNGDDTVLYLYGMLKLTIAKTYASQSLYAVAEKCIKEIKSDLDGVINGPNPNVELQVNVFCMEGLLQLWQGHSRDSLDMLQTALMLQQRDSVGGVEHADVLKWMAYAYIEVYQEENAKDLLEEAQKILNSLPETKRAKRALAHLSTQYGRLWRNKSLKARVENDLEEEKACLQQAVACFEEAERRGLKADYRAPVSTIYKTEMLARLNIKNKGLLKGYLSDMEKELGKLVENFGENHRRSAWAKTKIAWLCLKLDGHFNYGLETVSKATKAQMESRNCFHPKMAGSLAVKGRLMFQLSSENATEAKQLIEEAYELYKKIHPQHPKMHLIQRELDSIDRNLCSFSYFTDFPVILETG